MIQKCIKRNVYHTVRLLTATTQMKDSCTTSNRNIHDFRDENGETMRVRCSLGYYKGRVSVVCMCYSLLLSSVCYTVVLRYSSMIM
jgi:hypothetical protein